MHSYIIQISKEPISEDEYITECDYCESNCIGSFFDYVSDVDLKYREEILENKLGNIPGLKLNKENWTLTIEDKNKFFEGPFCLFEEAVKELTEVAFADFPNGGCAYSIAKAREAYHGYTGLWVDNDGMLDTLYEWVRWNQNGTTVYLGHVVDYHY